MDHIYACTSMSGPPVQSNRNHAMVSTLAPSVVTPIMEPHIAPEIDLAQVLYIHTTPYFPAAWQNALSICNLLSFFPNLVHDITYGSPISNPPALSRTFLPPNLASANIHPEIIEQELLDKVAANCMSGPYTIKQASIIFGGPF